MIWGRLLRNRRCLNNIMCCVRQRTVSTTGFVGRLQRSWDEIWRDGNLIGGCVESARLGTIISRFEGNADFVASDVYYSSIHTTPFGESTHYIRPVVFSCLCYCWMRGVCVPDGFQVYRKLIKMFTHTHVNAW